MEKLIFNTNYKNWFNEVSSHIKSHYPMPFTNKDKGKLCLDIGSNVGSFSCTYHDCFEKIIAIEASKSNSEEIENNLKQRSIKNVTVIQKAVYSKGGETKILKFWRDTKDKHCGNSSIIEYYDDKRKHGWTDKTGEHVETIGLNDIYELYGDIDYMKLDVEGGEYDFLMNKDMNRIKYISMELHVQLRDKKQELKNFLLENFSMERELKLHPHEILYLKK